MFVREETTDLGLPDTVCDSTEGVVAFTGCLVCGAEIPLRRYENGFVICRDCKRAVLAMKKMLESYN